MTPPEAVNSQITDAVTQSSVRVLADVTQDNPADSLAAFYQETAHAMATLAQNAVNLQQQQDILQQAATNQGIMQIYSTDTAPGAAGTEAAEQMADALRAQRNRLVADNDTLSAIDALQRVAPDDDSAWAKEIRNAMHAVADSLRHLQALTNDTSLTMLKQAAIGAILARLVAAPDQLESFRGVLKLIEEL